MGYVSSNVDPIAELLRIQATMFQDECNILVAKLLKKKIGREIKEEKKKGR